MSIWIPVLKKDHEWDKHTEKLDEEYKELEDAIHYLKECEYLKEHQEEAAGYVVEEAMDVIQVAVGIIHKVLQKHEKTAMEKMKAHFIKLINRGWKFVKVFRVEEE